MIGKLRTVYAAATSPRGRLAARAIAVGISTGLHSGQPGVGAVFAGGMAAAEIFTPLNGLVGIFKPPAK